MDVVPRPFFDPNSALPLVLSLSPPQPDLVKDTSPPFPDLIVCSPPTPVRLRLHYSPKPVVFILLNTGHGVLASPY